MKRLCICLDARLVSGTSGGIEQVIIGLAYGLSQLTDGDEEYFFLTTDGADDWLRPYVGGPCRLLRGVGATHAPRRLRWLRAIPGSRQVIQKIQRNQPRGPIHVPHSDGTIEKIGADIMHFTTQMGFLTSVPSIYHPHDLQHLHLPELFTPQERLKRETVYRALCEQAHMVAVTASWGKCDLVRQYGLDDESVQVVPWAPVLTAYPNPTEADLNDARRKFALPTDFIFYPAQTYAHKNHLGLIEALADLRKCYGLTVSLVSSGRCTEFYSQIEHRAQERGMADAIHFLGFVSPLELQCLYRLCRCVIIPSQFEAASFPLWEAFLAGAPAACSNVTSLPAQAGDAALLFDPNQPGDIADAIHRLWTDVALRDTLIERGRRNVAHFSWDRTARIFRAHYRRIANRPLTEEDQVLLAAPPLL